MSRKDEPKKDELTEEELEEQNGEALPDREAMSLVAPQPIGGTIDPQWIDHAIPPEGTDA